MMILFVWTESGIRALPPVSVDTSPRSPGFRGRGKARIDLYVPGLITGLGAVRWMVDTGSGHMTVNEEILALLKEHGLAHVVKNLRARLADGREREAPGYSIDAI